MFRFDSNKPQKPTVEKNKSIISDKRLYKKAVEDEIVEEKPQELSANFENVVKGIKLLRNAVYKQAPDLQFSKGLVESAPELAPAIKDDKMSRQVADCIKNTYINSAINDILNTDSSGILNVEKLEEDIWWKIGYAKAMESLASKLLGLLISAVLSTIFMQLNKFIKILADGVGNIKIKFSVIIVSICINIGIVLKAIVIMFVHYYIYELIRIFEQFGWCYLTYYNEKTGESRTTNIYIDLFGSVVDKGFYPKYTAPHLQNDNNRDYHTTLNQCESAVGLILKITFGWNIVCNELNIKDLKDIGDNSNTLLQFANYFRSDNKSANNVVQKCLECQNNCNDYTYGTTGIDNINTGIQVNQMLSAMSAHNITNQGEGIYNDISNLLDEMQSNAESQINSLKLYDTLSETMMPVSAMTDFNKTLAKMEIGMKKISEFLKKASSKQLIDLTPSKIGKSVLKTTKTALELEQKTYNRQLIALNKKITKLEKEIETAKKEKEIIDEEYYNNPVSITKKNSMKLVKYDIETMEKKLAQFSVERDNIKEDLEDIIKEKEEATNNLSEPTDANAYRKTLMADAAVIFALDLVCCTLSMLLGLLAKQYDRDPEKFKEITDSFWYKVLAEGQSDLIKETSPYVGLQMLLRLVDFIFSILGGVQVDLDATSETSFKFDASIDIMAMATEMAGNTAFTSVDTFIKVINEMVFAQAALLEKPPYWELKKINAAERKYLEGTTPILLENAFYAVTDLYKYESSNMSYFETPIGTLGFIIKNNADSMYKQTDTTFITKDTSIYYEVYERICPPDEANEFNDLMEIISSGQCLSLNFIFDYLLGYVKDFHTTLLIFKLLLEYEPKFNINASVSYESQMKLSTFSVFSDLLALLTANLDFFIKLCNLEQKVSDISELRSSINDMIDKEIERTTTEVEVFDGLYASRRTYMYDPYNFNEEEYLNLIEKEYNLPVEFEKKRAGGLLNERATNAWDYIKETKIANNTSRIDENIIGGNNE